MPPKTKPRKAKPKVSEQEPNAPTPPPTVPMACGGFRPLVFSKSSHRKFFVLISPFKSRLAREAEAHKAHHCTKKAAIKTLLQMRRK